MIPVYQSIIDPELGDCVKACVASILELPPESVPNFNEEKGSDPVRACSPKQYHQNLIDFLDTLGYGFVSIYNDPHFSKTDIVPTIHLPYLIGCHCTLSVPSQKFDNVQHCVVGKFVQDENGVITVDIVHDPNQSNEPYPDDVKVYWIDFIIKK